MSEQPVAPPGRPDGAAGSALGWAFYLACSWTWCIGMFLPVLLVRDHGVWGFIAFAVPNVLGAAAMGWVLRSRVQAERLAAAHAHAVALFSVVTVSFHAFWLAWLATWVRGSVVLPAPAWLVLVGGGVAMVLGLGAAARAGRARRAGVGVWIVGAGLLAAVLATPASIAPPTDGYLDRPPDGLLWLAPVCIFGFALCPYLDATFLRARAATSTRGARVAFTLGFGLLFLSMVLLTLLYAGFFASMSDHDQATAPRVAPWMGAWLLVHLLAQAVYTVEVHAERLAVSPARGVAVALLPAVLAAAALGFFWQRVPMVNGLFGGEVVYRAFMAFYGLLFPAYVWVCVIPTRDGHAGTAGRRGRFKLGVLGIAVAVAAPMYWMGFIQREWWWLGPGLGVVLASRVLVMRRQQASLGGSNS